MHKLLIKERPIDRERVSGTLIIISLVVIILSMVGIRLIDVKVSNIELVDGGLYTVITAKGPEDIDKSDILRIERTFTKASLTGAPVELDKIYTTKGFVYFTSLDPFFPIGQQLIQSVDKSVDTGSQSVWIPADSVTISEVAPNILQNANLKLVQPFSYAIGTPSNLIPILFTLIFTQYLALAVGGISIFILVFPLRIEMEELETAVSQEAEFCSTDEHRTAVAK